MSTALAPYRIAAVVAAEEPPIPEYTDAACKACGMSFRDQHGCRVTCDVRYCRGGRRWFLGLRKCHEHRPHMHITCKSCGARRIMSPKAEDLPESTWVW